MSRKHYEMLASTLKATLAAYGASHKGITNRESDLYISLVSNMADVLERDNPRFDRAMFRMACGLKGGV